MSTRRWAGASFGLLMGCFAVTAGCGGDDSAPGGGTGDGGVPGDSSSACSTGVVVKGCTTVEQNGQTFDLGCSTIVNKTLNGRAVCAGSGACVGTAPACLDPSNVYSCLQNCRPPQEAGADGGSSPLGTKCSSNNDCTGGLTCVKPTDNVSPGAGPPNGICTLECSSPANHDMCTMTLGGTCVVLGTVGTRSFCMENCMTGKAPPGAKCHDRLDMVCSALDPSGFGCVPLCATDSDCGTRKCDLGTGLCTDVITPGSPIGSPCTVDRDCAGLFCYPFDTSPDASSSAGTCTAICRLGNIEGCGFRTSPLDAGPAVGACLLSGPTADVGDIGICAQLCDTVADCSTNDSRWNCLPDPDVLRAFNHAGYCWLGMRPEGGTRDAAPEAGPPEASPPEASAPETGTDATGDGASTDGAGPDGAAD